MHHLHLRSSWFRSLLESIMKKTDHHRVVPLFQGTEGLEPTHDLLVEDDQVKLFGWCFLVFFPSLSSAP